MVQVSDWDRYIAERLVQPPEVGWGDYPQWVQQYQDVPAVSGRTRVAIVLIIVAMFVAMAAGIWVALQ
jgi:hypothetical protein